MTSILDLPSIRARVSRISVDEYHRQAEYHENGKRTELIRGIVVEKMSKSPRHEATVKRLFRLIWEAANQSYLVSKESPLTLRDSEPEPDISVVEGREDDFTQSHPTTAALVVEVAVSSVEEDRELSALYAEAGVAEYWIALPTDRVIEVYRQPENGRYREMRIFTIAEVLHCQSVPGVQVALAEVFAGL